MNIPRIDGGVPIWKPVEKGVRSAPTPSAGGAGKDRVDLGNTARAPKDPAVGVGKLARASSEVREERVAEVRKNVEDGVYDKPETIEQVARKLVDDGLVR